LGFDPLPDEPPRLPPLLPPPPARFVPLTLDFVLALLLPLLARLADEEGREDEEPPEVFFFVAPPARLPPADLDFADDFAFFPLCCFAMGCSGLVCLNELIVVAHSPSASRG
jgi:hypothetical protein